MDAERVTVTVPADVAEALRLTVADGDYASTSEVVGEALRNWMLGRDADRRKHAALREAIRAGDESGPSIPAEEVYADLRRMIAEHRARA